MFRKPRHNHVSFEAYKNSVINILKTYLIMKSQNSLQLNISDKTSVALRTQAGRRSTNMNLQTTYMCHELCLT